MCVLILYPVFSIIQECHISFLTNGWMVRSMLTKQSWTFISRIKKRINSPSVEASCNFIPILAILFQNYFKGAKIWWLFAWQCRNSTDCFVLEVLTVRVDFKMESLLDHSIKNSNRKKGKNGKRPLLEFLNLSLYPWKFQTK